MRRPAITSTGCRSPIMPPTGILRALPVASGHVITRSEAHLRLVCGSVFKTDDALREQRHGGFDSHALPPILAHRYLKPEVRAHAWRRKNSMVASIADRGMQCPTSGRTENAPCGSIRYAVAPSS